MKVTLRKASQIVSQIENWKKDNIMTPAVLLTKASVSDAESFLNKGRDSFLTYTNNVIVLHEISYKIKNSVGRVNSSVGINDRVGELNSIENTMKFINSFKGFIAKPTDFETTIEMFKNLKQDTTQDWRYSGLDANFVDASLAENLKKVLSQCKKRKNKISDELLALNSSNHIDIDDNDYLILESLDIV